MFEIAQLVMDAGIPGMSSNSTETLQGLLKDKEAPVEANIAEISAVYSPDLTGYSRYDNVSLLVRPRSQSDWPTEDANGDFFHDYVIDVRVSWGSLSEDPMAGNLTKKLELMQQVTALGQSLCANYTKNAYRVLAKTKAEHEASLVVQAARAANREVTSRAKDLVKSMRVWGSPRRVERSLFTGIADGSYEVSYTNKYDTKTYKVHLTQRAATINRLK